ncbi:MAG: FGGY family carbohydrate kinase [Acidimicrobiales bacterium]
MIDIGSSAVRAAVVRPDGTVEARQEAALVTMHPTPGLVELDAAALAQSALSVARACLAQAGPVDGVGVTNQRGTTVVWEAAGGQPVGPALSWQDLRTAGKCLELQADNLRLAPNESATKVAWLLDTYDPSRQRSLRFGTLDSWVVWHLSRGESHVTDFSNAAVSGLLPTEAVLAGEAELAWDRSRLERLAIPEASLPTIVPSSQAVAIARALPGHPPVCGIAGDQQASLIGQGCVRPGQAKATFGTGAFLDVNVGGQPPTFASAGKSGDHGCLPIIAWARPDAVTWGVEALMISAGTAVSWLVDDVGLLTRPEESAEVAARCDDTGDVFYVPALVGLGTPHWDFGARSVFIGMTAGTGRPELVRAVLRGVAQRGADLLEAAEADSGYAVDRLRVDGGMTANPVFVQELADACQRPVEISAQLEATSLGGGFLAGLAAGVWSTEDEVAALVKPRAVVGPAGVDRRERWKDAVSRSERWIPELSALKF